jgi:membrane-bound lytic murein transglycosylase B
LVFSLAGCGGASAFSTAPPAAGAPGRGHARWPRRSPRTASYDQWIAGFRPRALSQGISAQTFDRAFAGVGFNEDSIRRDRHQPEFTRPIWAYLDSAVSDTRIENGRRALREHARRWPRSRRATASRRKSSWPSGGWKAPSAPARHHPDHRDAGDAGL